MSNSAVHPETPRDALRESEEARRLALLATQDGIWDWNPQTKQYVWSDRLTGMLGYAPGEIVPSVEAVNQWMHPDDVGPTWAAVERYLRHESDGYQVEFRLRHKDGTYRWILSRAVAIFDDAGKPLRMVGAHTDITDARQAAMELQELTGKFGRQSRLFEQIATSTPDFIYVFDLSGRFLYANRRLLEVWGRTFEEAVGKNLYELGYPQWHADMHMREIARVIDTKKSIMGEVPFTGGSGISGIYEYIFTPVLGPDGTVEVIAGTTRDVTGRHRVEEELRMAKLGAERAAQRAEEANGAKDQFLAALSHELRTPLTPVLASAEMLEKDTTLSAEQRETVQLIRRNIELEARLIDDLLDLTRIARNKLHLHVGKVDVHEKIRQVMEICADDIGAKGLSVEMRLNATGRWVHADGTRFQQIVWNLVKNAVKFTPQGGQVTISTTDERLKDGAAGVRVEVTDTGIGIEPEVLPRIFDAFEQGGRETTRQFGGLGLGLAISKAVVELHGGTIGARSQGKDQGATFSVVLPVGKSVRLEDEGAKPAEADARGVSVLLVEDHADTRKVMARFLKGMGCEVRQAGSIEEAKELLAQQTADVLVSDIGLPDGSGVELMRHAKGLGDLKGIALSGYGMEEDVARSMEAGFAAHLTKPVNLQALAEAIRSLTRRS